MSHKHEHIVCPNCGYHATENYCARCGQANHLHKETFGGLIFHFIGHYFHYDSKFWQTLKALWFSPGKLTTAYWNKQQMRYIAPISLYIFISAVYFLVSSLMPGKAMKIYRNDAAIDSATHAIRPSGKEHQLHVERLRTSASWPAIPDEQETEELKEKFLHNIPKVFFFMIPLMAFVLQLLFMKRKELFYVDHIIYALHYHSFWFSIMFIDTIYPFEKGTETVTIIVLLLSVIYFIAAMRNVYKLSWIRSVSYSITTALAYCLFLSLVLVGLIVFLLR